MGFSSLKNCITVCCSQPLPQSDYCMTKPVTFTTIGIWVFLYMIDLYQITKFFDNYSPFILAISTIALATITAYYAKQTRFLTKNQLRPAFSHLRVASTINNVEPFDVRLRLRNVGIGAAFNIHVEYSIKGIKNSKQTEMIRDIEHSKEDYNWLVQNGQPLQHDRSANRGYRSQIKI